MSSFNIAFVGGGHMARALIGGLVRHGTAAASLSVGEPSEAARLALERDFGCRTSPNNEEVVSGAAAVVLAVKPQEARRAVVALAPLLRTQRPVLISVAAGIPVRSLESWCADGVPIVRAMPNRPALVGAGVAGLYAAEAVSDAGRSLAERLMQCVGATVWVSSEADLDVVTALSGSGPAYFFLLAEHMTRAAVRLGLDREAARVLAVETLHGAGVLAHAGSGDLPRLRAEVTSKGGTTEAALRVLDSEPGLAELVQRAMDAAAQRSRELAIEFGTGEAARRG